MAIRLNINGIEIVCDSGKDLEQVLQVQGAIPKRRAPRSQKAVQVDPAQQLVMNTMGMLLPLAPRAIEMLRALKEAFPDGLRTDVLANRLGLSNRSLAPITTAIRVWARKSGIEALDVMRTEMRVENGQAASIYRITKRGIEILGQQESMAAHK